MDQLCLCLSGFIFSFLGVAFKSFNYEKILPFPSFLHHRTFHLIENNLSYKMNDTDPIKLVYGYKIKEYIVHIVKAHKF